MYGVLALFGICCGVLNDKFEQSRPYYGTERDIFRNNPQAIENRKAVDEIVARQRREYEKRTGRKANW